MIKAIVKENSKKKNIKVCVPQKYAYTMGNVLWPFFYNIYVLI